MNRANQHALFQATNQTLLNIRQQEINYYTNLNAAFGTQAALIGGFTYGIFTQNNYTAKAFATHIKDLYWIFSAATIAAAIHVILTAMLLQVLGPGLALHGPVGSMVRACEGMREEQKAVVYGFGFMIISFSCSTLLLFWTVMSLASAIGSTVVWIIAVRFYYYYCERIYLRFYWKQEGDYLSRDSEVDPSDQYADHPRVFSNNANDNPMHSSSPAGSRNSAAMTHITRRTEEGVALTEKSSSSRRGSNFLPAIRIPFTSSGKADAPALSVASPATDSGNIESTLVTTKNIVMQGFLLMKHPPSRSNAKQKTMWKRYYFTLNGMGHFFYYRSRQEYRERPQAPKRKRPLILSEFSVTIWNGDLLGDRGTKGSSSVLFQFLLSPKDGGEQSTQDIQEAMRAMLDSDAASVNMDDNDDDSDESIMTSNRRASANLSSSTASSGSSSRKWAMRCDTEEELQMWLDAMRDISPSSFSD